MSSGWFSWNLHLHDVLAVPVHLIVAATRVVVDLLEILVLLVVLEVLEVVGFLYSL